MKNDIIKEGQQVFVTYLHENKIPFLATINSVGRSYFILNELRHTRFRISDFGQKESNIGWPQTYKVWLSKADYEESEELKKLKKIIIEKIPLLNKEIIGSIFNLINL